MNIPTLTYFDKRGLRTPLKYATYTLAGALPFGALATIVGLSFFGAVAFMSATIGSYVVLVSEREAWKAEKEEGRLSVLNQATSIVAGGVPWLIALGAWMLA